ncbi:hypothetical protein CEXT_461431 [Caerostris extrusa]|uniref:Uncharacterized protein n=1 Tax=Caerostris extrusa TaxID=172846 RepID=A0AAV4Q867_CAEEX|nr:hypothetical protein CEXT_461431 [Caerostris extrusa]
MKTLFKSRQLHFHREFSFGIPSIFFSPFAPVSQISFLNKVFRNKKKEGMETKENNITSKRGDVHRLLGKKRHNKSSGKDSKRTTFFLSESKKRYRSETRNRMLCTAILRSDIQPTNA